MDAKTNRNLIIFGTVFIGSVVGYIWMINQPFFDTFIEWAQQNFILYFTILVMLKIIAIVWPPLPGGLLTLGSIPVIGWFNAYLADLIGGLIGASIAYYLGSKYGHNFLKKLFDDKVIDKIYKVKIVKNKEYEAILLLRLFSSAISEAISYGSGLLKIRFKNFFLATLTAAFLYMPFYYLADGIFNGKNVVINAVLILSIGAVLYKLRGRYFEWT